MKCKQLVARSVVVCQRLRRSRGERHRGLLEAKASSLPLLAGFVVDEENGAALILDPLILQSALDGEKDTSASSLGIHLAGVPSRTRSKARLPEAEGLTGHFFLRPTARRLDDQLPQFQHTTPPGNRLIRWEE